MNKFKPHYDHGEHALMKADYVSSPYRMFRAGLMAGEVSMALAMSRYIIGRQLEAAYFMALQDFTHKCVRHWEFKATVADRFTRPGAVFH